MPTPAEIASMAAALMNDAAQNVYTNEKVLPYLNMTLDELQETFELNNVPVTNEESAIIPVPAGIDTIGFNTNPKLPQDLVEIQRVWERPAGVTPWNPMTRKEFIPRQYEDQSITQFLWWAWRDQEIRVIPATADNELKLDYVQDLFNTPISINDVDVNLPIVNVKQYLGFQTAAFCAMYVAENETRAMALEGKAQRALDRELGIPTKGRQAITTRRQPFMGSYRRRGYSV